jgi:hypothetical protein
LETLERIAQKLRLPAYILGVVAVGLFIVNFAIPAESINFTERGWLTLGTMWSGGVWVLWKLHRPWKLATNDGTEEEISPMRRGNLAIRACFYLFITIWFTALIAFTFMFTRM